MLWGDNSSPSASAPSAPRGSPTGRGGSGTASGSPSRAPCSLHAYRRQTRHKRRLKCPLCGSCTSPATAIAGPATLAPVGAAWPAPNRVPTDGRCAAASAPPRARTTVRSVRTAAASLRIASFSVCDCRTSSAFRRAHTRIKEGTRAAATSAADAAAANVEDPKATGAPRNRGSGAPLPRLGNA